MTWLSEDRDRLAAFRRGDRRTLEAVYRHYCPAVADFLRRGFDFQTGGRDCRFTGVRDPYEVDELLQDVFLRAFRDAARMGYGGVSPYGAYLRVIARNAVVDRFRTGLREAFRRVVFIEDLGPAPEGGGQGLGFDDRLSSLVAAEGAHPGTRSGDPDPEETAERAQVVRLCQGFVDELPEGLRPLFIARFVDGLPQDEVARRLARTRWGVRADERRLRKRFLIFARRHGLVPAETPVAGAAEAAEESP